MELKVPYPVLALRTGQVLTLDDGEGARIEARLGTLWVTQEGSSKDHIVGPGDSLVVTRPGRTVVQALQPAWLIIEEPAREKVASERSAIPAGWREALDQALSQPIQLSRSH